MVEILLHHNADPTVENAKNETAYSLAVVSGRKVVAMLLAEADRKYRVTYCCGVCVVHVCMYAYVC